MNINFTVFDKQTGRAKRWGECPEEMCEIQANDESEISLNVIVNSDRQMLSIVDGVPVIIEKPEEVYIDEAIQDNKRFDIQQENQIIADKMEELLYRMAIAELKKEGGDKK
jgi:hypothetical protein